MLRETHDLTIDTGALVFEARVHVTFNKRINGMRKTAVIDRLDVDDLYEILEDGNKQGLILTADLREIIEKKLEEIL